MHSFELDSKVSDRHGNQFPINDLAHELLGHRVFDWLTLSFAHWHSDRHGGALGRDDLDCICSLLGQVHLHTRRGASVTAIGNQVSHEVQTDLRCTNTCLDGVQGCAILV